MDANPETLSDMFRSFHSLLVKIRDLLRVLNLHELHRVERALCTGETQVKFGAYQTLCLLKVKKWLFLLAKFF